MSSCSCSRSNDVSDTDANYNLHERILISNLANHGFKRAQVKGDGNCLFYSLAYGLINEINRDLNGFGRQLQNFGLSSSMSISEFAACLRKICVNQWKSNEEFYTQFIAKQQVPFKKEVKRFSKSGVSDSILGDIVPLTIANTLNVKITIFTSVQDLSRIDIEPTNETDSRLKSNRTIFLAYNQWGIGHYDAARPYI